MTYLMNISFLFNKELEPAIATWINDQFIPVVTDPVLGFDKFELFRLLSPIKREDASFCIQIRSTNRKKIENWFGQAASPMCHELFKKYDKGNGEIDLFITPSLMESIE